MNHVTKRMIHEPPFREEKPSAPWGRGNWPCSWICHPSDPQCPFTSAFKKEFDLTSSEEIRVHVSSDERYELYLDGELVGRGPERGSPECWYFETYDLDLEAGSHLLVARVWALGPNRAPTAQMSMAPGFLLAPESEEHQGLLGTGLTPWQVLLFTGLNYPEGPHNYGIADGIEFDGASYPWGFETGDGSGWIEAKPGLVAKSGATPKLSSQAQPLVPAILPAMLNEPRRLGRSRYASATVLQEKYLKAASDPETAKQWDRLLGGDATITLPAHSQLRILIDLDDYYCAYPELTTSRGQGSRISVSWAESLYHTVERTPEWPDRKGNRDEVEGKFFVGYADYFRPDGGSKRKFRPLWWRAGRYLEILISTAEEALIVDDLIFYETRYPLEMESRVQFEDPRLEEALPVMVRALQTCSHETYMDCPYYEQLMYTGDTRLEILTHYALQRDYRLPAKAVRLFQLSLSSNGLTKSRYPSQSGQFIPPFSLWWVTMVHDLALWRGEETLVRQALPVCRLVLDQFTSHLTADGVPAPLEGWNFMDWVPGWQYGCCPDGDMSVNSVQGWQLVLVLALTAQLEEWMGEPELASRATKTAGKLATSLKEKFWSETRGLFADNPSHTSWSEHAQCLAILSGQLTLDEEAALMDAMLAADDLAQTTIYFAHYYFEACQRTGRMDAFMERMQLWFGLVDKGFKTTFEKPGDTRSDCHAWGAHPLYHYYATILGVRPASPGFETVRISPQLGKMESASGSLVHPRGHIDVDYRKSGRSLKATITLPEGITGTFRHGEIEIPLSAGKNQVTAE
ncbi:alpha-L-rhamnosidase-related protein [Puniceicoccus vermicola]|uniref:Alpha-L-rhamnosidase n=1 Tax=Puniceicoccus vermicola TaxID=388746 RepID=A0A7X1B284_9BACT|nr:alpha-L-rhamnosidase C-terminal domain-containing protein [Puniceicoccus vermicola]MBC2603208.1 alpha-L-rhamnosidase [Puniceicoccus vermicola]